MERGPCDGSCGAIQGGFHMSLRESILTPLFQFASLTAVLFQANSRPIFRSTVPVASSQRPKTESRFA